MNPDRSQNPKSMLFDLGTLFKYLPPKGGPASVGVPNDVKTTIGREYFSVNCLYSPLPTLRLPKILPPRRQAQLAGECACAYIMTP